VLATVVLLLERSFIRVGNPEYARENKSFGLTTMQDRHVDVKGSTFRFHFRGKGGKQHEIDLTDRRVAKIIAKLQDLPGQELFQYVDEEREIRNVTSQDVNDYLREITGEDFTAKDFRTWAGTVLAALALQAVGGFTTKKEAKANVKNAIGAVAEILRNTPAICRKCYIHPAVVEAYLNSESIEGLEDKAAEVLKNGDMNLRAGEKAMLKFLQQLLVKKPVR
jgi:DNA topoisomerase-1